MIYKIEILFLICLLTACSSVGEKEVATTGELLRQAAFYGERLQFQPALETYRLAIRQAGEGKRQRCPFRCLSGNRENLPEAIIEAESAGKRAESIKLYQKPCR